MLAKDQRLQWRESLRSGVIPDEILKKIDWYESVAMQDDWRSSKLFECMAECAVVLRELLEENK